MDDMDIYGDLDEFHEREEKKSKELLAWEEKYEEAIKSKVQLEEENQQLKKNIKMIEVNFQNLLDTARAEIRRKQREIDNLRLEYDNICFRRTTEVNHRDLTCTERQLNIQERNSGKPINENVTYKETHKSSNRDSVHILNNTESIKCQYDSIKANSDRGMSVQSRYSIEDANKKINRYESSHSHRDHKKPRKQSRSRSHSRCHIQKQMTSSSSKRKRSRSKHTSPDHLKRSLEHSRSHKRKGSPKLFKENFNEADRHGKYTSSLFGEGVNKMQRKSSPSSIQHKGITIGKQKLQSKKGENLSVVKFLSDICKADHKNVKKNCVVNLAFHHILAVLRFAMI